ncbi:hypothetical protein Tco_1225033 [Tanacetum coccineum]
MNCVSQKKDVIDYPRFMKKFPSIPPRLEEDYHSIKDDIPLVSVYTTRNVTVRGMLIPDAFLTKEIHANDDYKVYETVFVNVVVLMNQPKRVVSTEGMHRSTPRAHRTPTLTAASPQGKKRKQSSGETSSQQKSLKVIIKQKKVVEGENNEESYADKFVDSMIHDDVDDSGDMIEPGSHKEHPEVVVDDDDNKEEKKDEKKDDEMGSLENRTEKMQTPIPTTPRSPRINLSSDKNIAQELTDTVSLSTATTSKDPHKKRRISSRYSHLPGALRRMCRRQGYMIRDMERKFDLQQQLYLKMKSNLQDQANDLALWDVLKRKFEKSSTSNTSCREDDFHSQRHDYHQDDDAPLEGEKRVKRHKTSKSLKSARGSSSKQLAKHSTTYVTKQQQQQQEWTAWEEETVIDEDEVIPKDETPEMITEFQN